MGRVKREARGQFSLQAHYELPMKVPTSKKEGTNHSTFV